MTYFKAHQTKLIRCLLLLFATYRPSPSPISFSIDSFTPMATQQWKHHVFISFRGVDVRHSFLCHLNGALHRTGLKTFVDDQLRIGKEINTALLQAIQDSKVALIIFSENYASSNWCLDELLKIIECHETHNQIVIPVFYGVTPSDVRRQNGRYGESFAKHIKNAWYSNKIQKWKDALTKAANISGWDSDVIREDNKLIDQIVRDVLEKLKLLDPCSLEDFVGLDSKISQVKKLLATGSSDVRMLGIWGMGGIGKTTIAETIFDEVSSQFEGRCFVRNVREVSKKEGILKLLQQLISELLEERDVKMYTKTIKPALRERLKSKRVFVVFDDVSDRLQLKDLNGNQCWFGAGCNIIVTSRDKKVFEGITDNIYKVEALSDTESHQLFVRNAFKERQPAQDHIPLIDSFVNYAGGNPLAIKVLGSSVCGDEVELWKKALTKLSNCPNKNIQDVLKFSYDGLDREEKAIFLDIACFFKGENKNEAERVFTSCGLSANVGVRRLVGKSLVTISRYDKLEMHDLLQDMGREIVREESKDRHHRSRYWDAEEIRGVFEENEGTEAIEIQSISLNMSQIGDIVLDPNVFKRMLNLKFLRFYTSWGKRSKLHLTRGLHFLPSGLRYLYWDQYPLESLPTDFDAKELVVLHLPGSNIKQILKVRTYYLDMLNGFLFERKTVMWIHNYLLQLKQGAGKLKAAVQSLIDIFFGELPFGIGNIKVPSSSWQSFSKLTSLDMSYCRNLKSFSNNVNLQCLEILNLWQCSNLKIFSEISTNIRRLVASFTAIKEVHSSSIEGLSKLEELNMSYCEKLESLPSNIYKLQALQRLDLEKCRRLKKFPELLEPMYNLRAVKLSFSGIEAVPFSIDNMKGLKSLDLEYCKNIACFPESFGNLVRRIGDFKFSIACKNSLLAFEDLEGLFLRIDLRFRSGQNYFRARVTLCRRKEVDMRSPVSRTLPNFDLRFDMTSLVSNWVSYLIDLPSRLCLRFFSPYIILDLSHHRIRELPKDLGSLSYLRKLYLQRNDFVEIPASIKQLSLLKSLRVDDCPKLRSLPQLPTSLCKLTAVGCESLKTLLAFKQPIFNGCKIKFNFSGRLKLEEKECEAMAYKIKFNFNGCLKLEKKECEAMAYKLLRNGPKDVQINYPGNRIPEWFRHQTTGDIIRIKLPSNWFLNRRFFGFAFCVVLNCRGTFVNFDDLKFECYFENNYSPNILFPYQSTPIFVSFENKYSPLKRQQHVLVWCVHDFNVWISERRQLFRLHCINMASFKFCIQGYGMGYSKMKKCGVTPLYMKVDEGCSGIAPLYMQADEGYVQGDVDDQDDGDENAYWMLESLLPRKMSTKMKMKLKRKDNPEDDEDEHLKKERKIEDTDDDMTLEDDEDELFETEDGLSEANDEFFETEDELFEILDGLSEANDEFFETTSTRTDVLSGGEKSYP